MAEHAGYTDHYIEESVREYRKVDGRVWTDVCRGCGTSGHSVIIAPQNPHRSYCLACYSRLMAHGEIRI